MAKFSRRTIRMLGDELSGWWVLATIADLFDDAGIALGPEEAANGVAGQRRGLMMQYISTLDPNSPADTLKLVEVVNHVLFELVHRQYEGEIGVEWRQKFLDQIKRDGFVLDGDSQIESPVRVDLPAELLSSLADASAIHDHLQRLNQNLESDPRLAVSVAKELVESTAKLVLRGRNIAYTQADDVPALVARAQEALKLNASGVEGADGEAKALKRILQSLTSLTQGITELRNEVGTGHGRESVPTWVRPRHARLAAGAARTWCTLMLETLEDPGTPWRT